jgi:hypothetical protein
VPYPNDPQPNFAYFVYDGIPSWSAAIRPGSTDPVKGQVVEFGTNVMRKLPAYHLISKRSSVEQSTWGISPNGINQYTGDSYLWTGTLVFDGKVYDHIQYRSRGGVWRYAMGKNAWKIHFNRGHRFAARDNNGRLYQNPWAKTNWRPNIQQGDYLHRGEQGLFEAVGYKLSTWLEQRPATRTTFNCESLIKPPRPPRANTILTSWGSTSGSRRVTALSR